jgi:hypothetical protein
MDMSENDVLILSNREIIPDDEYIFSILGDKAEYWESIVKYSTENFSDTSGIWNYYNDGKQWLFKMVQKKKTLFWAGILYDTFRITFYFGDKAEPFIEGNDLPAPVIEGFKTAKRYGAIRPVSIKVFEHSDVETVLKLIVLKSKMK